MTSIYHTFAGERIMNFMFDGNPFARVVGAVLGAFPDLSDWVLHNVEQIWNKATGRVDVKFPRWWFWGECHYGKWNKYGRWLLPWGFHTEVVDKPVHVGSKTWIPQFKLEWKEKVYWKWPVLIQRLLNRDSFTLWDAAYILLEAIWWCISIFIPAATVWLAIVFLTFIALNYPHVKRAKLQ